MLSLSQAFWSLFLAVIGGVVVWYGSNFIAEPISRFLRMREQIRSRMLHYENVGLGSGTLQWHPDGLRLHAAELEFRELATDLRGFSDTRPYVTAMLRNVGYDLTRASGALIGRQTVSLGAMAAERRYLGPKSIAPLNSRFRILSLIHI